MINETEQTNSKFIVAGAGILIGCILAVLLSACSTAAKDAGVGMTRTSTITSSVATSTKT